MSGESLSEHWSRAKLSDRLDGSRRYHQKISNAIRSLPAGLLLDAGCGVGRFSRIVGENSGVIAVDLIFGNCQKTKITGAETICADVRNLPFRNRTFDGILSVQVLGSFKGVDVTFEELIRVLNRPGRIVATFLNSRTPYVVISSLRDKRSERKNQKNVRSLALGNSLNVISVEVTGVPLPAWLESRISFADSFLGNDIILQAVS